MRVLLFGTGEYYNRYKMWFAQEDVLALIDNSKEKIGTLIDGKMVISPSGVYQYDFDAIFVMSFYIVEMKKQLVDIGIEERKIHHFYDIHKLIYKDALKKEVYFYNTNIENSGKKVLLLNQDLTLGGPALALFQVAKTLRKNGYDVTYASQIDGPLREILEKEGYKTVVDVNLLVLTMNECEWIKDYALIICNTINFHVFLSERDTTIPMIWWLHDALFFYDGIDKKAIKAIQNENLKICAVGPVSEKAIKAYRPDFVVNDLLYGVEDEIITPKSRAKADDIIKFVTIGYIESRKGQDVLVNAIKLLPEEVRRKTQYSFIGKKTSMLARELMAECAKINEIEFVGTVDRKEINSILDECDVMICPSREDPMPTVCAEAMMHSVPCIVSDSAGTVKYITNQLDGIVYRSENPEELAEKIIWTVKNYKMLSKMGKAARKLYENIFDLKVFEQNLMRVIHEMEGI